MFDEKIADVKFYKLLCPPSIAHCPDAAGGPAKLAKWRAVEKKVNEKFKRTLKVDKSYKTGQKRKLKS